MTECEKSQFEKPSYHSGLSQQQKNHSQTTQRTKQNLPHLHVSSTQQNMHVNNLVVLSFAFTYSWFRNSHDYYEPITSTPNQTQKIKLLN